LTGRSNNVLETEAGPAGKVQPILFLVAVESDI
jgi:hypothetical protein